MGVVIRRWVWLETIGVVSGCFPHITYISLLHLYLFFFAAASLLLFSFCYIPIGRPLFHMTDVIRALSINHGHVVRFARARSWYGSTAGIEGLLRALSFVCRTVHLL